MLASKVVLVPRPKLIVLGWIAAGAFACAQIAGLQDPPETLPSEPNADGSTGDASIETPEGVAISPSELTLPKAACGEQQSGSITLANNGDKDVAWEVRAPEQPTFALRGAMGGVLSGSLKAKDSTYVYVDAKGTIPGNAAVDLVVKIGSTLKQIPVKLDVHGGLLSVNPPIADFGDVRRDTVSAPISMELKNDGNEQVSITGFADVGAEFALAPPTIVIPAGGKSTVEATLKAGPASDTVHTATVKPVVAGALCNAVPAFTLKGKRVNTDVTVGPLTVDFKDWYCNSTPPSPLKVTVSNYSQSTTATYNAALTAGAASRFTIVSGATNVVPVAPNSTTPSTRDITLQAKMIVPPLGEFTEDLVVTITDPPAAAALGPKTAKVQIGAYGAILEITPATLTNFAPNETKNFAIKNVGNVTACVTYSDGASAGFTVEPDDVLDPNVNNTLSVQFSAANAGTYNYQIGIQSFACIPFFSQPAVFCSPPIKPTVSATR